MNNPRDRIDCRPEPECLMLRDLVRLRKAGMLLSQFFQADLS
jgi:hypothetical protein